MCGIFGSIGFKQPIIINKLYKQSESRGKDSSGIAVLTKDNKILVYKIPQSAKKFIKSQSYKELLSKSIAFIGHARMVTNGSMNFNKNNQPVIKDGLVAVHNGIIVNDNKLWQKHKILKRKYQVDTEILLSLFRENISKNTNITKAFQKTIKKIEGAVSTAILFEDQDKLLLYTNTGSLYYIKTNKYFIFASEKLFLTSLKIKGQIKQLKINKPFVFNIKKTKTNKKNRILDLSPKQKKIKKSKINDLELKENKKNINEKLKIIKKKVSGLKRCSKCILPETMPFIKFDKNGVCNYCHNSQKIKYKGQKELEKIIKPFRKNDGTPDCIVAFSGGRDSSFGLHYVKNILKLNPIAYSYDWGMLTDLGRRNQSLMTSKLGVEHILISADIKTKRENIRRNVLAWLKRPRLGTIPLFMAGDKQYFYYANQLMKQMNIKLLFLCECPLEKTDFKTGFCGVPPKIQNKGKFYSISIKNKIQMIIYYLKEYIKNPSYLNKSLLDTLWALKSYYFTKHNFISLYDYIKWDETKIDKTLINKYNWETDPETNTTWRIGDGTAAFYNYIYYTMSGLTEHDTFTSNQIRNRAITRNEALKKTNKNNQPRINSLNWYANTIGIKLSRAIKKINEKSI